MAITFLTGQRLTADLLNTLADVTANKPIGRAVQSAVQSLADNTFTAITFTTEDYDTHDFHSITTNTSRVTPTVAGYYRFSGAASIASQTTPVSADVALRLNGTTFIAGETRVPGAAATLEYPVTATVLMNGTTDYIELMARQDSSGAVNTVSSLPINSFLEWSLERPT